LAFFIDFGPGKVYFPNINFTLKIPPFWLSDLSIFFSKEVHEMNLNFRLVSVLAACFLFVSTAAQAGSAFELLKDIEVHGFASSSYTYNANQPKSATNTHRIFDTDHNSFKFDVGELVLVKETPNAGDIGFRTDITYGFSVPEVTKSSPGVTDSTGARVSDEDFDLQQGYVSYNARVGNGLQLDLGKFITHIGAEVIEGHDGWNNNFSRSFLFGLAIPFTHTGLRASYAINDKVSVMGMVANGWDNTTNNNDGLTVGAQLAIAPTDNVSLLLNWAGGDESSTGGVDATNIFDVVLDLGLSDRLSFQLNFDYGEQTNGNTTTGGDAEWWGLAGILRHDCSDWFSINLRAEYFDDKDGVRATAASNVAANSGQELWEFTITPEIRVNQNMVVRFEYRHDESNQLVFGGENSGDVEGTQDTLAVNALVYF
jgi:hypothetical protein